MKNKTDTPILDLDQSRKNIKKACLRLLTRRDHSRKEIQDKLSLKGFERSQVAEVIDELSSQNWQDDGRYAEAYARVRSQKGFGPVRIAFELRQQGVDTATIEQVLRIVTDDWPSLMEKVYFKKFPRETRFDLNERGKCIRFLLQRGFPNAMINTLLERQSKNSI